MISWDPDGDVGFEELIARPDPLPLAPSIPKKVHFVYTQLKPQNWQDYAVVRSAIDYWEAEEVNIWAPQNEPLQGEMWERILALQNVTVREFVVPHTVMGKRVANKAHTSDIARIKILYEEGGMYMDLDVMALKSSDDVIYAPKTKSVVMATQVINRPKKTVSNGMIMAKPGAPFLKRWMEKYKDFNPGGEWDHTSGEVPTEMFAAGEPDLTLLDDYSWHYPQLISWDEMKTDRPAHSLTWVGKSWHHIQENYGLHLWKWGDGNYHVKLTPEVARTIDTPLMCKFRPLFDNLDGDGYYSTPMEENKNCSFTEIKDLKPENHLLFSDYQISLDTVDMKWVDSSGHHLHGFAQTGTSIDRNSTTPSRTFELDSQAWLPVPLDWDARVGTARMTIRLDPCVWDERDEIGLFKIRNDYAGEIVISLKNSEESPGAPALKYEWLSNYLTNYTASNEDDFECTADRSMHLSDSGPNELAITFDRRDTGLIAIYLNGTIIANGSLPLISSSKIGDEIWINAREWLNMDTGFRGSLYRFSMYAGVVPAEELGRPLALDTSSSSLPNASTAAESPSYFWYLVLFLLLSYMLWRWTKLRAPGYIRKNVPYAKRSAVPNGAIYRPLRSKETDMV